MFERFTERACAAVVRAERDVRDLGHRQLGTEHLLLGLVHDDASIGGRSLTSLGVTYAEVRRRVASAKPSETVVVSEHVPFSARAKQLLQMSARHALRQEHRRIGTSDLTLSLFGMTGSTALRLLDGLGVDPEVARARVLEMSTDAELPAPTPGISRPRIVQFELSPEAQEFAVRALRLGSSYVARRYMPARFARNAPKTTQLFRELNVGPLLRQRLTRNVETGPQSVPRTRAACSVCGTSSPNCGTLYTSADGVLTCERCAGEALDEPRGS